MCVRGKKNPKKNKSATLVFGTLEYPGTWIEKKQNIMYPVHGFEEKSKFHVPGYMKFGFEEKNIISCYDLTL